MHRDGISPALNADRFGGSRRFPHTPGQKAENKVDAPHDRVDRQGSVCSCRSGRVVSVRLPDRLRNVGSEEFVVGVTG